MLILLMFLFQAALKIYESLGFVRTEAKTHFETADLKMELYL